jgi:hypothetical protein
MKKTSTVSGSYTQRVFYASFCVIVTVSVVFLIWAIVLLRSIRRTQLVASPVVPPSIEEQFHKIQGLFGGISSTPLSPPTETIVESKAHLESLLRQGIEQKRRF